VNLRIPDGAFPYLVAQRGALDDMQADRALWGAKYDEVIAAEFASIAAYLPRNCDALLDVGSGLGGIDALINDHYGGGVHVTLLDGVLDPPQVDLHRKTFNHMGVARHFLKMNGVEKFDYIDANDAHRFARRKFDLVVSFKSWSFHVEPAVHLDLVVSSCIPKKTELLIDVRRDKAAWLMQLDEAFRFVEVVCDGPKARTMRYIAR